MDREDSLDEKVEAILLLMHEMNEAVNKAILKIEQILLRVKDQDD